MKNKLTEEQTGHFKGINKCFNFMLGRRFVGFYFTTCPNGHTCYRYSLVYTKYYIILKRKTRKQCHHVLKQMYIIIEMKVQKSRDWDAEKEAENIQ